MKIYNEEFEIKNNKIKKDYTFCIIGDIHNTKYSFLKTWKKIIDEVKSKEPDFIIIPGDLIYTADDLLNVKNKERMDYLLKGLSDIAPIYITYGNHDLKDGKKATSTDTSNYFNSLENVYDIHLVNNSLIEVDKNIHILGVSPIYTSYYSEYKDKWAENFINSLLEIDIKDKLEDSELLILTIHSPEILKEVNKLLRDINVTNNPEMIKRLNRAKEILNMVDIFVCAHMHNGNISRRLEKLKLFNGGKGIVVSEGYIIKNIFKKNDTEEHQVRFRLVDYCRGMHDMFNGKMVITRGVTKWCQPNVVFGTIDHLCPKDITTVKVLKK